MFLAFIGRADLNKNYFQWLFFKQMCFKRLVFISFSANDSIWLKASFAHIYTYTMIYLSLFFI